MYKLHKGSQGDKIKQHSGLTQLYYYYNQNEALSHKGYTAHNCIITYFQSILIYITGNFLQQHFTSFIHNLE